MLLNLLVFRQKLANFRRDAEHMMTAGAEQMPQQVQEEMQKQVQEHVQEQVQDQDQEQVQDGLQEVAPPVAARRSARYQGYGVARAAMLRDRPGR